MIPKWCILLLFFLPTTLTGCQPSRDDRGRKLHDAVAKGDVRDAKAILDRDPSLVAFSLDGTPLHTSAEYNRPEMAELLLQMGAVVDSRNKAFQTPLMLAVRRPSPKVVSVLIKHSAQVGAIDSGKMTALHFSAFHDNPMIVNELLSAGAQKDALNGIGISALHCATSLGNAKVVEALLKGGAKTNDQDEDARVPLDLAAIGGHKEVIGILLKHGVEMTPICAAVIGDEDYLRKQIVQFPTMLSARDVHKASLLHYSAQAGQLGVCKLLRFFVEFSGWFYGARFSLPQ